MWVRDGFVWPRAHSWADRVAEFWRLWSWDLDRGWMMLVFLGIVFPVAGVVGMVTNPTNAFDDAGALLFFAVLGVGADVGLVKGLDARLEARARPAEALGKPAFLEMLEELGLHATRPNSIRGRADGTSHLTKPLGRSPEITHAYVRDRDGRETWLMMFATGRGLPEFRAVAATRVSQHYPFAGIRRDALFKRKDRDFRELKVVGAGGALPKAFREWAAKSSIGIDFEVMNGWATTASDEPLNALNAGPLIRALDRFVEALACG